MSGHGCRQDWAGLYEEFREPMIRLAAAYRRRCAKVLAIWTAEDIWHIAVLNLLAAEWVYEPGPHAMAFLSRCVRNAALSLLREESRRLLRQTRALRERPPVEAAETGDGPLGGLIEAESSRRLAEAMARLEPRDRAILAAHGRGETVRETAARVGLSHQHVHRQLHRARRAVYPALE